MVWGTMIPTKAIKPADTDRGCRGQGGGENDQPAHPHHVDTQPGRLFVSEPEHIEEAAKHDEHRRRRPTRTGRVSTPRSSPP